MRSGIWLMALALLKIAEFNATFCGMMVFFGIFMLAMDVTDFVKKL